MILLLLHILFLPLAATIIALTPDTAPDTPREVPTVGKCGLREYFFEGKECPWISTRTKKIQVHGVVRLGTTPESCWYDHQRYHLSYNKNGDETAKRMPLNGNSQGNALFRHPQCHIGIQMVVAKQPSQTTFNDFRSPGFQDEEGTTILPDSELKHHMDNQELRKMIDITKAENDFTFVKPKGWQEIVDSDGSVVIRPHPDDFQHLPRDLDDISQFEELHDGFDGKNYGKLQFGPIVGLDGGVIYEAGYPKYHDQFKARDYFGVNPLEKPRYDLKQYPNGNHADPTQLGQRENNVGQLVEDDVPAYCHGRTAYSENTRWIRFLKEGRYIVGYNNLEVDHCIMGIKYNVDGMKRMISEDRYLIVDVGAEDIVLDNRLSMTKVNESSPRYDSSTTTQNNEDNNEDNVDYHREQDDQQQDDKERFVRQPGTEDIDKLNHLLDIRKQTEIREENSAVKLQNNYKKRLRVRKSLHVHGDVQNHGR